MKSAVLALAALAPLLGGVIVAIWPAPALASTAAPPGKGPGGPSPDRRGGCA
ncbi:hypothetical protein ACXET9_07210 [Brachybacterium sp. DNPG3]